MYNVVKTMVEQTCAQIDISVILHRADNRVFITVEAKNESDVNIVMVGITNMRLDKPDWKEDVKKAFDATRALIQSDINKMSTKDGRDLQLHSRFLAKSQEDIELLTRLLKTDSDEKISDLSISDEELRFSQS